MAFTAEKITDAKRVVRGDMYMFVSSLSDYKPKHVLFLPGRTPEEEISCARLAGAEHVTAIDTDRKSCKAAEPHADRVLLGCVSRLNVPGEILEYGKKPDEFYGPGYKRPYKMAYGLRQTNYDFVSLDFCTTVENIDETGPSGWSVVGPIGAASKRTGVLAVFASYGRESSRYVDYVNSVKDTRNHDFRLGRGAADRYLLSLGLELPDTVATRLIHAWMSLSNWTAWRPLRIYRYIGKRVPMFGAVFSMWAEHKFRDIKVEFLDIRNEDIRPRCVAAARKNGTRFVSRMFSVPAPKVAAWLAVDTRKQTLRVA